MVAILKLNNEIKIFFQKYVWGFKCSQVSSQYVMVLLISKGFFENPQTNGKISEIGNTFVGTFFLAFM